MSERTANPYAAPQIDLDPPKAPRGRAMRWWSWIVLTLLGVHIVTRLLSIGVDLSLDMLMIEFEAELIDDSSRAKMEAGFARLELARTLRRASWGLLVLAWLPWSTVCNRLARDLGFALQYGTLATIGGWFVPIFNLVGPRRVVAELWQASTATELSAWRTDQGLKVVNAWWLAFWAMFLVRATTLIGIVDTFSVGEHDPIGAVAILRGFIMRDVIVHGLAMIAAALAMVIVAQISSGLHGRLVR